MAPRRRTDGGIRTIGTGLLLWMIVVAGAVLVRDDDWTTGRSSSFTGSTRLATRMLPLEAEHSVRVEDGYDTVEEEGEEVTESSQTLLVMTIIVTLILLTMAFEKTKHHLEHAADHSMLPILDHLFGEMTVLGFLSVTTFVLTKLGLFDDLGERLFGRAEHKLVLELFEVVHYALFSIMVLFGLQVLFLVQRVVHMGQQWKYMDRICNTPVQHQASIRRLHDDLSLEELDLFQRLQEEFLLERAVEPPFAPAAQEQRVTQKDFNFGSYLTHCLIQTLCHVVHVDVSTWAIFGAGALVYYGVMAAAGFDLHIMAWLWMILGWLVFFGNICFEQYLQRIRSSFAAKQLSCDPTATTNEATELLKEAKDDTLPSWCIGEIEWKKYLRQRSWLTRFICHHHHPNRQDALFWLEREGTHMHKLLLQLNLIFISLSFAMLALAFIPSIHVYYSEKSDGARWRVFVYSILAVTPLFLSIRQNQRMIGTMGQVECIGSAYRRPDVVSLVIREEKTGRIVRAFLVLERMQRVVHNNNNNHNEGAMHRTKSGRSITNIMEDEGIEYSKLEEVMDIFRAFDKNGDGQLDPHEIKELTAALQNQAYGVEMQDVSDRMLASFDTDDDGLVSKEEFVEWYAKHGSGSGHRVLTNAERAEALFSMFDVSHSGEISIGEFKTKLDQFHMGFSVNDVGELVQELDHDGNLCIGVEEFEMLLEKYGPEE